MANASASFDLHPLPELLDAADFPLSEFIPTDALSEVFASLYYGDLDVFVDGENLVLDFVLAREGELSFGIPGVDAFAFIVAAGAEGWTFVPLRLILGPDFACEMPGLEFALRVSDSILKDVATGGAAELRFSTYLRFDPDGVTIGDVSGVSLAPAYLCGTEITIEADSVTPVFGAIPVPDFLADQPDFRGVAMESLRVTLPASYLQNDSGEAIVFELTEAAVGTTGFTGILTVASADLSTPIEGTLLGFPFRFRAFSLQIDQNAFIDASLGVDVRFEALEDGAEKWIGVDLRFGEDGSFVGALSATQPAEAGPTDAALASVEFAQVMRLAISALRVEKEGDVWAFFVSGNLKLLLDGAEWPDIAFDEIGFDSAGHLLMPDGGGITFASPLAVDWHFARLTVSKFLLGYDSDDEEMLRLKLSAGIELVDGVPAGASVEGLTVRWKPGSGGDPSVSFDGIGIEFGVPGSFQASLSVAYTQTADSIEFRGQGALELTALDASLEIAIVIGRQDAHAPEFPEAFTYLYLFVDAKLMPSGIPIGSTGISLYGVQGLVAYNMALDVDESLAADERYYQLFIKSPIGLTDQSKWVKSVGQNAIGLGVLLGTADKGFVLSVKGMFIVAFPDLTLYLQARANILSIPPTLTSTTTGNIEALLVYAAGDGTLLFDLTARWETLPLYSVSGHARAYFSFTDASAWYIALGEDADGKRVVAQALYWGAGWLFDSGFWFRIDGEGLVTGIQIDVGLRAESGGFWVEASGHARGEMALTWRPFQWEGSLELWGRIGAGYKGISVGVSLDGAARARVFRPYHARIEVEACVEALFWEVCASFTFEWKQDVAPVLETPLRRITAQPRHWTPRETSGSDELDLGKVELSASATTTVPPHSEFLIDFLRPMVDNTGLGFQEPPVLDDGGFITVGKNSGYSAAYRLDAVALTRDPGGDNEAVTLWGTWDASKSESHSTLKLLSSERFSHDGSRTYGFLDGVVRDYCAEEGTTWECVTLEDLAPGAQWAPDGSLVHWDPEEGEDDSGGTIDVVPATPGAVLVPGGADDGAGEPADGDGEPDGSGTPGDGEGRPGDGTPGHDSGPADGRGFCHPRYRRLICVVGGLSLLVALVLLLLGLVAMVPMRVAALVAALFVLLGLVALFLTCLCCGRRHARDDRAARSAHDGSRGRTGDSDRSDHSGHARRPPGWLRKPVWTRHRVVDGSASGADPEPGVDADACSGFSPARGIAAAADGHLRANVGAGGSGARSWQICCPVGSSRPSGTWLNTAGRIVTETESWTIPDSMQLLEPGVRYRIDLEYTLRLKNSSGTITESPATASYTITADDPPGYEDALRDYITSVYPSDGARPVYTGYDLYCDFVESYVPYLYASVEQRLLFRLFDGQGQPVLDAEGNEYLVPATTVGPHVSTVTETIWLGLAAEAFDGDCMERRIMPPAPDDNRLRAAADTVTLTPNSTYEAWLVAEDAPDVPLHRWGFTTSSYATFTELGTLDAEIAEAVDVTAAATATAFEDLARALGLATIAYVEHFTATPLRASDGTLAALLIEAPEPLDFSTRLSVTLNGAAATAYANADGSRGIVVPRGAPPAGAVAVRLIWQRDAGSGVPVLSVNGSTSAETVTFDVDLSGGADA